MNLALYSCCNPGAREGVKEVIQTPDVIEHQMITSYVEIHVCMELYSFKNGSQLRRNESVYTPLKIRSGECLDSHFLKR